ncbi:DUF6529 family protein [Streptomyces sp. LS1784]|uniref:DUF6529 family protein n=1 Tax=Streptomyces sp. LS1784 TaxID=2851533 RepID=UPI001CCFB504|nr:DUF6529 family protein [Streptomyces sp. LS1784]
MNTRSLPALALRLALAATLAASGYIHAQLYIDGYRSVHVIGSMFLLQASTAFAVAALLLLAAPLLLRIAAAAIAIGTLIGFAASRTTGLFGFSENGLQPAPQALLSLIAETLTLLILAIWQASEARRPRRARPTDGPDGHEGDPGRQPSVSQTRPGPRPQSAGAAPPAPQARVAARPVIDGADAENARRLPALALRLALAATLAASGYIHAQLYIDGYRLVHVIGSMFLLQASTAFAVAALLLLAAPLLLRIAAAAIAIGTLIGFAASRTTGLFGFSENGLQPAPQALLSLIAETLTLLILVAWKPLLTAAVKSRAAAVDHVAGLTPLAGHRRLHNVLWLLLPVAVVAGLLWYGRVHTPNYETSLFGNRGDDAQLLKAQLGSALLGLALIQLVLALWIYGRLPALQTAPHRVRTTHRLIGLTAFLLSLPIARHCITAYGVQFTDTRVALHSLTGCFLYGAFVAKVIVVRHRRWPGWALPLAGGTLVTAIALIWYAAPLWYLNGLQAPGL